MTPVLYSVIIPTRDRPESLSACLRGLSALNFRLSRSEVIIINDGGRIDPESVIKPFLQQMQITLLSQSSCGGPGKARNAGAAAARGKFLIFIDDDCVPDPNWLSVLTRQLETNPDAAYGGRVMTAPEASPEAEATQMMIDYISREFNPHNENPVFLTSNNFAVSRNHFMAVGGFDITFPLAAGEDRDFCLRWTQKNQPLVFAAEAVVEHHHEQSLAAFVRQHFRYGRGAFRFHARHTAGLKKRILPGSLRFYIKLILYPINKKPFGKALLLSGLLLISQITSFLGYLFESSRKWKNICI